MDVDELEEICKEVAVGYYPSIRLKEIHVKHMKHLS
jgi:hypothetical protein